MRVVEHRRHSLRDPSGPHLSRDGRRLARRIASSIGPFERVVTSPKPRAVETAEALGFSVDATLTELGEMPDDAGLAVDTLGDRTFAEYVRGVEHSRAMAEYGHRLAELMRRELSGLPDGGRLLIVSHGGVVEFSAAATRPLEARNWGPPVGYLEGVRLVLDRGAWVRGEVLRVPS